MRACLGIRFATALVAGLTLTVAVSQDASADQIPTPRTRLGLTIVSPQGTWTIPSDRAETLYPDRARRIGKNGSAYLVCKPAEGEVASTCDLVREEGEYGFGPSALKLMTRLPFKVEGDVQVRFEMQYLDPPQLLSPRDGDWPPRITEAADDPKP
ncbi:hypothetical protein AS593_20725 [Caulobacter vibrioides]|nr:hypothetical protein AS593_20725 [Caulobacter vibrioides]